MLSKYAKINLSRYCAISQLPTNELEGVLQNGESTLYINEDGSLCIISKDNDNVTIQRLLNQINNVKIPEFNLPNLIDEYIAYALSAVKNGNGYDLTWAKIPTSLEYNADIGSLPAITQLTKYRTITTDNLQKINITNQSLLNTLNSYDLGVLLNENESTIHKNTSGDFSLSEKTLTGITTNIFKNNLINDIAPPSFPSTQLTGNNVYCLSAKTISGSTTMDWLLVNAKLNYNTGNTISVNEIVDIVDISKTKINLSRQTNLNISGLTNNDIIEILKKRNDYNEFILHKSNDELILSNKIYGTDMTGEYYTINNIKISNDKIYGEDIPAFEQGTEEDYILAFIYTNNTLSSNTLDDWELTWIPATPKLSYAFILNTVNANSTFNIYKNNNPVPVVSETLIGSSNIYNIGGYTPISNGDIFYTKVIPAGIDDNTFNIGTGFNNAFFTRSINQITLQSDGKILVGGGFSTYSGVTRNAIIRLNTGGTIDNTFTIGSGLNQVPNSIVVQPDNKILVGGGFSTYSGVTRNFIVRLNTGGTIDNTFTIGTGFDAIVYSIILQPDNKILVGGSFSTYSGVTRNNIIRLNTGGTIDNTFNIGTGFSGGFFSSVYAMRLQPDNKILVGGSFSTYSGVTCGSIIRLNTGGTIDNTFTIGSGFDGGFVLSIVVQPDNKILVGGNFSSYSGVTHNNIIRLNSNGTVDNTFNTGTGFTGGVASMILQSDGKILIGGSFNSYNGVLSDYIIRLNPDGSVDDTFPTGSVFDGSIGSIVIQPDKKILVGGTFSNFKTTNKNGIVRLTGFSNAAVQLDMKIDGNTSPYAESIFVTNPTGVTTSSTFTVENCRRYEISSYVT